jgi:DNA polymerase-3 subunit alpha
MSIRIGLSAIKNVGDIAIDMIIKERESNGPFKSFTDFCLRVSGSKVNKRVLESLIKVGAFDSFGERNAILTGLDIIRSNIEKLSLKRLDGQFGLFDGSEDKDKHFVPIDKFPDVEPMQEIEKLNLEKLLLGVYVTENPISKILEHFQGASLPKIKDLFDKSDNTVCKFTAVITKFKVILTKKDSSKMAFVTLTDESNSIEGVIFPKSFIQFENLLTENQAVYIEGKISSRNDEKSILIDLISLSLPENTKKFDFIIKIPKDTT